MAKYEVKLHRLVVKDPNDGLVFICMVNATSEYHAKNLIYQHGLIPIRMATDEDYDNIYVKKNLTTIYK